VKGQIDHMAIDLAGHRLFVAELGNDSIGVVDIEQRKVIRVISGLKEPQGWSMSFERYALRRQWWQWDRATVPGADLADAGRIELGDDADNIRVDSSANKVFIGYGSGALAVIDPQSKQDRGYCTQRASRELSTRHVLGPDFVNVPAKQTIAVVDRASGKQLAAWPSGNSTHFAMALNEEAKHLLVAFRMPAKLTVLAMDSGSPVTSIETCGDIDDMFVDAKRRRL